jgi:hypothetical protein
MPPIARFRRHRATIPTLFLLVLWAFLASGCGGSGAAARLRSRLLSVGDLPAGWAGAAAPGYATRLTSTPCLSGLANRSRGWTYRTAGFVEGKSIPNLGEALASGARVEQVWNGFDRALSACRSAALVLGGTRVKATVHRLTLASFGRSSSAYAWAFSLGGVRIGFDLVLFQTGRYAGSLSYASLGQPSTTTVEAFTRAAVAKAQNVDNAGLGRSDRLPAPLTIDAMADQTSGLLDTLGPGRTDVRLRATYLRRSRSARLAMSGSKCSSASGRRATSSKPSSPPPNRPRIAAVCASGPR